MAARTEQELLIKGMREALEGMYRAWQMLLPLLKNSAVEDYELVCTTAPRKCLDAIAAARKLELELEISGGN
jgi:hypothetical protein